ncbi:MAG: hypothetical protein ABIQ09_17930 [Jatrophihabitantaceae bacterium]
MKQVLSYVAERRAVLDKHPLFDWVAQESVPLKDRLMFMPSMITFTMGFRDLNKWVLRYPLARDDLQRGINIHTFEDQTHSRLFLQDWRRLGLDDRLGWQASDTLWWLFLSEANEVSRGHAIYFLSMATADQDDPLLRFAHAEVIEACGSVFFNHVAKIAAQFEDQTKVELPYLGPYHLALESGHMDCEDLFEEQELDDQRRRRAVELADAMFDIFFETFDTWLKNAQEFVTTGAAPRPRPSAAIQPSGVQSSDEGVGDAPSARPRTDGPPHASQQAVQRLLEARKARTAEHPFYLWLHNRGQITALQALRRFLPMWAMDIMGYRDLNLYAMRYQQPQDDLAQVVNGWVDDLSTHNTLYLNDWRELDLDQLLGWSASDTLDFCYLDAQVDVHRRNIVRFTQLAADHPEPLLRLWLMHALESTGDAWFENCRILAREVEATTDIRLDYLGDRHEIAHRPVAPGAQASVLFKSRPMSAEQAEKVLVMIDTVFDAVDEQLDISLDVALSNKFDIP